ncbi:MAG: sigma-54 interaction domain-containing protein [Methylocystaceae bacterium]
MQTATIRFLDVNLTGFVMVQTGSMLTSVFEFLCDNDAQCVLVEDEVGEIIGLVDQGILLKALKRGLTKDFIIDEVMDKKLFVAHVGEAVDEFIHSSKNYGLVYNGREFLGVVNKLKLTEQFYHWVAELEATIEASFDSYFVCDAKGIVLRLNQAYTRMTGIKSEEIVGRPMSELVSEGFYDRSATLEVIKTKKSMTFTQRTRDGKCILVTGNPIFDSNGELVQILTNGRDITELDRLKQEVDHAMELTQHYQRELKKIQGETSGQMVIASEKMKNIMSLVAHLGSVDSTVLILGESGVGKEIIAQELHNQSGRKDKPYIRINCAAIPDNLLESELFGYEPGAFTGANRKGKRGIFELASGGTLFLDEIGDLSFNLQGKLLRVLQENEIVRVGGTTPIKIDVRIITATNKDLWDMSRNKGFREDLLYRLNVVPLRIPPLRERKEEIPVLVEYFVNQINEKYGLRKRISPSLMNQLMLLDWPGNIRELKNVIENAMVTAPGDMIYQLNNQSGEAPGAEATHPEEIDFRTAVENFESDILRSYIKKYGCSRKVASALNVSQTTVVRKAARYGLSFIH